MTEFQILNPDRSNHMFIFTIHSFSSMRILGSIKAMTVEEAEGAWNQQNRGNTGPRPEAYGFTSTRERLNRYTDTLPQVTEVAADGFWFTSEAN